MSLSSLPVAGGEVGAGRMCNRAVGQTAIAFRPASEVPPEHRGANGESRNAAAG